ncbi:hypothetical protein DVH24_010459 [Malus domestica]|uniref:Uncharacterized protein n=1 Tax=Malus domestica TaxID=3750 RepID=A0A498JWI4_MALDO|nr:hypothetical protein DVH24_010459 [Malus domestica]
MNISPLHKSPTPPFHSLCSLPPSFSLSSFLYPLSTSSLSCSNASVLRSPMTIKLYLQKPLPFLFPTLKNGDRGFSGQFSAKFSGIGP